MTETEQRIDRSLDLAEEEIDLHELLSALRRRWRTKAVSTAAALACAFLYLHLATPRYSIALTVTPANSRMTSQVSKLGGLASLAGIKLPIADEEVPFELYLEGLTSRQVADLVAQDTSLMRPLFPHEWNEAQQRWTEPSRARTMLANVLRMAVGRPARPWRPPDGARLQEVLQRQLKIERKRTSPVVTISMRFADPKIGRRFLWRLHEHADEILRRRTLARTTQYIDYLREKLRSVEVAEHRQALFEILSEQERQLMIASSTLPYAAEPFEGPVASATPKEPNVPVVLAIALLLGFGSGAVTALLDEGSRIRRSRNGTAAL